MKASFYLGILGAVLSMHGSRTLADDKTCLDTLKQVSGEKQSITATIDGVHEDAVPAGICGDSVYLKVSNDEGQQTVFLAPRSYIGEGDEIGQRGQKVEITGVAHQVNGTSIFIAREVIKPSGQVLSLRDDQGRALWLMAKQNAVTNGTGQAQEKTAAVEEEKSAVAKMEKTENAGAMTGSVTEDAPKDAPKDAAGQPSDQQVRSTESQTRSESEKQPQAEKKISVTVGHNVVDAVDDVRETTSDLARAMVDAKGSLPAGSEAELKTLIKNLDDMEKLLDSKAEATDSSWLNWMADRDYSVTVRDEIRKLGEAHKSMGKIFAQAKTDKSFQVVVGHNLVDQVDDSRETVGDLIHAINNAGPQLGWFDEDTLFQGHQKKLEAMEKLLDEKAERADNGDFFGSSDFRVTVNEQINTLGEMLTDIADRINTSEVAH